MHFNENIHRPQAKTKEGELRWSLSYPKGRRGVAVAKKVKGGCTHGKDILNFLHAL